MMGAALVTMADSAKAYLRKKIAAPPVAISGGNGVNQELNLQAFVLIAREKNHEIR